MHTMFDMISRVWYNIHFSVNAIVIPITVTSHTRVSWRLKSLAIQQFNSLFRLTYKKTLKPQITVHLCGESIELLYSPLMDKAFPCHDFIIPKLALYKPSKNHRYNVNYPPSVPEPSSSWFRASNTKIHFDREAAILIQSGRSRTRFESEDGMALSKLKWFLISVHILLRVRVRVKVRARVRVRVPGTKRNTLSLIPSRHMIQ